MIFARNEPVSIWFRRGAAIAGLLLTLAGTPLILGYFCITLTLVLSEEGEALTVGMVSFVLLAVMCGGGIIIFWHSLRSLQGRPSKPMRLPPAWLLAGVFGLCLVVGASISQGNIAPGLFFPPLFLAAATLPPLWAVSWFIDRQAPELTWRRGLGAFVGGATLGVAIAVVLEVLFPTIMLVLVLNLADTVMTRLDALFNALAGENVATAMTSPGFVYAFIQLTLIAPVVEELAKPLVTLPILGRMSRRGAFLVGAMAGAGFAAIENVIYAGFGYSFWAGILVVRALGSAVHPLGAGLVTQGWHDVLRGESNSWRKWLGRFGLAVGLHACWNGGSLLIVILAGAGFFGHLPPHIDILGVSAAGITLAVLAMLGLATLWGGRSIVTQSELPPPTKTASEAEFLFSDKALALWALACLAAIVPAGIAGLEILMR